MCGKRMMNCVSVDGYRCERVRESKMKHELKMEYVPMRNKRTKDYRKII